MCYTIIYYNPICLYVRDPGRLSCYECAYIYAVFSLNIQNYSTRVRIILSALR